MPDHDGGCRLSAALLAQGIAVASAHAASPSNVDKLRYEKTVKDGVKQKRVFDVLA